MEVSGFLSEWQEQEQQRWKQEERKGWAPGGENGDFSYSPPERLYLSYETISFQPLITAE